MSKRGAKWYLKCLFIWLTPSLRDEVIGDLLEAHDNRKARMEAWKATFLLMYEALLSFNWKQSRVNDVLKSQNPFQSLKYAVRFLKNKPALLSIHLIGFSASLSACLLLWVFYSYETSFDTFHEDHQQIHRLVTVTEKAEHFGLTPWPTGPFLNHDYPDLKAARVYHTYRKVPSISLPDSESLFYEDELLFADSTLFQVLDFKVIRGPNEGLLTEPDDIVLTQSLAEKLFGTIDVIGKEILFESKLRMKVTGIIEDARPNSHLQFKAFASLTNVGQLFEVTGNKFPYDEWYWTAVNTYVKFPPNFDAGAFEEELARFTDRHIPESVARRRMFKLQPLAEIHLNSSHIEDTIVAKRNKWEVNISLILSFLILLVAVINAINLSTASAITRIKNLTIKRIIGGSYQQIIFQLVAESVIIVVLSFLIATLVSWIVHPVFNRLLDTNVVLENYLLPEKFPMYLLVTVLSGIMIGIYPAVFAIRHVRKQSGRVNATNFIGTRNHLLKRLLITFQLMVSMILIYATGVIYAQSSMLVSRDLGFTNEEILMIPIKGTEVGTKVDRFMTNLEQSPYVKHGTVMSDVLGRSAPIVPFHVDSASSRSNIHTLFAGLDFVSTYGLKIVEGRDFNPSIQSDTYSFLINESAKSLFKNGWENGSLSRGNGKIIGVIQDFHFENLTAPIKPLIIGINDNWSNFVALRIDGSDLPGMIQDIENRWEIYERKRPFNGWFLDEKLSGMYKAEEDQSYLTVIFSILSIIISGLGLFSLIGFTIAQKIKEIGIRKVLGANGFQSYFLLIREYVILTFFAAVIAAPSGYMMVNVWLDNYPLRVENLWLYSMASLFGVIAITLLTVTFRSIKAANVNPVEILKYE